LFRQWFIEQIKEPKPHKPNENDTSFDEQTTSHQRSNDHTCDHVVKSIVQKTLVADTGGPVLVSVNIYLRSISKIDDVNMEYSAQFTFREEWRDARLAYERFADENTQVPPFVVLATSEQADLTQQIWMPDTFFQNEKWVL
uniref:Neur_chan_LBD domain-containing protein n=1 Tax=Toxocara canis TaxID=6265 RepID=A0A183U368_TOXCA